MANKLIPVVKKALASKYGFKNVSVKNGQGTAWGWVETHITVPENYDPSQKQGVYNEAQQIAKKAVKDAGMEFYTYCDDGGYGDRDCFLLSIN